MSIEENLSRVYTINLGKAWLTPQYRRTDRVINMIKEFAERHMKTEDIKLDQDLNRQIWKRGKTNPPRKVRVKMIKDDDGTVTVSLYEEAANIEKLPQQEESKQEMNESKETAAEADQPSIEIKHAEKKEKITEKKSKSKKLK